MILALEYRNRTIRFGAVGTKRSASLVPASSEADPSAASAKWLTSVVPAISFRPLARALKTFGFDKKPPTAVVALLVDSSSGERVSWSTIRAAVITANALAFAWHVPVASVKVRGDESTDDLAVMAERAAATARPGEWLKPEYDGEPNITVAKAKPL